MAISIDFLKYAPSLQDKQEMMNKELMRLRRNVGGIED